ncbi:hypothetical protein ACFSKN_14115 [Mariniflexile gromovii]|uniref:Anti-sigma factor n=1 Tax=Mariniflexile gromovii TaxID=362523 RepID=A0ABS4BRB8_9FLAO|nr:hypothetical protein [Mariniflexile gromovii]MBP0903105.1 hypothetical protein [Mariniflexile gromovii]
MELNKFDNNIKEKLEARSLQPSSHAWKKLSERLDHQDKKQNKKTFWWLGIAASMVGVLFVAFQFFNTEAVKPKLVDSPTVIQKNENIQVAVDEVETQEKVIKEPENKSNQEKLPQKEKLMHHANEHPIAISRENNSVKAEKPIQLDKVNEESLTLEEQKIQDVVAKVQVLKSQNIEVTDAVIDNLLLEAQKEIRFKRMYNTTTGIVDANMLLQEVEEDLDQSFRSKVFEAIKASYSTVKSAVAQRNN